MTDREFQLERDLSDAYAKINALESKLANPKLTLRQLNDLCSSHTDDNFWFVFKDVDTMLSSDTYDKSEFELHTPYSDGMGGKIDEWSTNPNINRTVVAFKQSGWQSNIYYVVLE